MSHAPLNNLPILAGIQPAELHRRQAMPSLSCLTLVSGRLLYQKLADLAKQPRRLRSQYPFMPAAKQLLRTIEEQNIMGGSCLEFRMAQQCSQTALFYPLYLTSPTGIGSAKISMDEAKLPSNQRRTLLLICECGMEDQTVDHIIQRC